MSDSPTDFWFFLSYARRDGKGGAYIKKFFRDLAFEVAKAAALSSDLPNEKIGFFDKEGIETGDHWDKKLAHGLQKSRTLVCLYSPSYFASDFCRKELNVFLDRLDEYAKQGAGDTPPLIFPVLWNNLPQLPKPLPDPLASIQFDHEKLGAKYAEHGLEMLIRTKKNDYLLFLNAFKDKLVKEAKRHHPLPERPDFPYFDSISIDPLPPPAQSNDGPGIARFIYIAGDTTEIQREARKEKVDAYHNKALYWKPYLPDIEQPVVMITQDIVNNSRDFVHEYILLPRDIIKELRKAESENVIVVIVVDPWTVKVRRYKEDMGRYDKERFNNCGVLVIWNEKDDETKRVKDELLRGLKEAFPRLCNGNDPYFRRSIGSLQEFEKDLIDIIYKLRSTITGQAPPKRQLGESADSSLPLVAGPSGAQV